MASMRLPPAVVSRIASYLPAAEALAAAAAPTPPAPAAAGPSGPTRLTRPSTARRSPPPPPAPTTMTQLIGRIRAPPNRVRPGEPGALGLAHAHLNGLPFHAQTASARALDRRRRIYTSLVLAFLDGSPAAPHAPARLAAASSLLARQAEEHVAPDARALTAVLRAALSAGQPAVAAVQAVLPLLPSTLDRKLLTLVLTSTIRETAPPPAAVRAAIAACLGPDAWGWDLWAVLIGAHAAHGDFRGALQCLGEARRATAAPSADAAGAAADGPARAFTTVLALWTSTRFSGARPARLGSRLPTALAHALSAPTDTAPPDLPPSFLVAWLDAERVADNRASAAAVCAHLTGLAPAQLATTSPPSLPDAVRARLRALPDAAFVALAKLLKVSPAQGPAQGPPRRLRAFAAHLPASASAAAVDATLSAIGAGPAPDLALLLHLAQTHPAPTARTIDVLAGALVRASRAGAVPGLFEHGGAPRRRGAVMPDEWDMVSCRLHEIRRARAARAATGGQGAGGPGLPARQASSAAAAPAPPPEPAAIPLPLSAPLAALEPAGATARTTSSAPQLETHRALYPKPPPASGPGVTFAPSPGPAPPLPAPSAARPAAPAALLVPAQADAKPRALIGPTVELLKAAVVADARARRARRPASDAALLSAEMARVREECGRRPIRWNKWGVRNL